MPGAFSARGDDALKLTSGTTIDPEMLIVMERDDLNDDEFNCMLPDE